MSKPADGFLSRWAQRKAQARNVAVATDAPASPVATDRPVAAVGVDATSIAVPPAEVLVEPLPTLADVTLLTRDSDYSRFVASGVDEGVKRAAMKKLFADPHFNVMDGLDTYIDDYGKPDPIPLAMLRQMNQSKMLRLFDDADDEETKNADLPTAANIPDIPNRPDDDPDLRLQQDPSAGQPGADQGAGA